MKKIFSLLVLIYFSTQVFSQQTDSTESKWSYSVSSDIVSRYIWRGTDYCNSPAFQPDLEISYGNFTIGTWGSATFNSFSVQETDLFASFEVWKFKFSCWDYFYMNMDSTRNNYFNYSGNETGHDFSFETEFTLSEKVPLKFLIAYNFFGADTAKSTYLELSYSLQNKVPLEFFAGFTPNQGYSWYGNGPGFVNVGVGLTKECKISNDYSIPVYCKLIFNPQRENVFLVAGLTF